MNHESTRPLDALLLAGLFYDDSAQLGEFEEVTANEMPPVYRGLLHHSHHMTVTMEQHHGSPVSVDVLDVIESPEYYSRKILLRRDTDNCVVQFGIVRLNLDCLAPKVRREIEKREKPLGRILIEHDVLRSIHLASLWKVALGEDLAQLFGNERGAITYGRTARIYCNEELAVEVLEIPTLSSDLR